VIKWNYRIVRHESGDLSLHEVYYDADGKPTSMTAEPVTFACHAEEGREGIIKSLEMALHCAKEHDLFVPPPHWAAE
jgi:YD repeat-containing protein